MLISFDPSRRSNLVSQDSTQNLPPSVSRGLGDVRSSVRARESQAVLDCLNSFCQRVVEIVVSLLNRFRTWLSGMREEVNPAPPATTPANAVQPTQEQLLARRSEVGRDIISAHLAHPFFDQVDGNRSVIVFIFKYNNHFELGLDRLSLNASASGVTATRKEELKNYGLAQLNHLFNLSENTQNTNGRLVISTLIFTKQPNGNFCCNAFHSRYQFPHGDTAGTGTDVFYELTQPAVGEILHDCLPRTGTTQRYHNQAREFVLNQIN
jgi:hypothetical protein